MASIDVPRDHAWAIAWIVASEWCRSSCTRPALGRPVTVDRTARRLVVAGSVRTRSTIDRLWDDSGTAAAVEALREDVLVDGAPVDYFLPEGSNSTVPMMLYQFHLPHTTFTVVSDPLAAGTSDYVFADDRQRGTARRAAPA